MVDQPVYYTGTHDSDSAGRPLTVADRFWGAEPSHCDCCPGRACVARPVPGGYWRCQLVVLGRHLTADEVRDYCRPAPSAAACAGGGPVPGPVT